MSYKDNEFKAYITGDTPNYEYHHTEQSVYIVDKIPDVGTEWSFEPQGNYICGKVKSIAPVKADSNTIRSPRANPMSFYYDCFEVCLDNLNDCPDCLEDTSYIVAVEVELEDLATLLTDEILDRVPMLHEQEDTPYPDRIVHAIYSIPLNKHGVWYLTEYGPETSLCYGLVENGDCGWGNFSIEELTESGAQRYIIEDLPCTFRQLKNSELKHQLTQKQFKDAFGELMLWEGDETSNLKAQTPKTKVPAHADCQWR